MGKPGIETRCCETEEKNVMGCVRVCVRHATTHIITHFARVPLSYVHNSSIDELTAVLPPSRDS